MQNNELIDRYVHAVGQQLPRNMRGDIEQELRSLLQDTLEEQLPPNAEPSDKIVAEVLRQFGKPEEMAANYRPKQVLIGDKLFPIYRTSITGIVAIAGSLHLLLLVLLLVGAQLPEFVPQLSGLLWSFVEKSFTYVAIATLIFAILERADNFWPELANELTDEIEEMESAEWNPLDLPPVNNSNQIDRSDLIASVVFSIIFIGSGILSMSPSEDSIANLFAPPFLSQVPWLIASWTLDAMLNIFVLGQGKWTTTTRWLKIAEQTFGLFVIYRIFGEPILNVVPEQLLFPTRFIVGMIMVIIIGSILQNLYRLLSNRKAMPTASFQSTVA